MKKKTKKKSRGMKETQKTIETEKKRMGKTKINIQKKIPKEKGPKRRAITNTAMSILVISAYANVINSER